MVALLVNADEGIAHLIAMYSYWGEIITILSLVYSEKACFDKNKYQFRAVVFCEMSMMINIAICCLFWSVIAPKLHEG